VPRGSGRSLVENPLCGLEFPQIAAVVVFSEGEEWISRALGFWMIVSPWLLWFAHTRVMHTRIGVGCVVVYLAGLELLLIHDRPSRPDTGGAHGGTAG
jgi:hypothetical protein